MRAGVGAAQPGGACSANSVVTLLKQESLAQPPHIHSLLNGFCAKKKTKPRRRFKNRPGRRVSEAGFTLISSFRLLIGESVRQKHCVQAPPPRMASQGHGGN